MTDRPVAAIDCGTNTIRLLIGALPEVSVRESRLVRLGQGVDRTGLLDEAAMGRAFAVLDEYAALLAAHGVTPDRLRFCATSATRDAGNAEEFTRGVERRLGVRPEVIDGQEEARLGFVGVMRGLRTPPGQSSGRPVLVVDIGGGSTELVLGESGPSRSPSAAISLDIGSVRLHERHLHDDPASPEQVAACVADIDAALDAAAAAGVDLGAAATVVGVAGTSATVAAGCLGLSSFDAETIDQSAIAVADSHAVIERLVAATVAERLALGYVLPGRADVIDAGALILDRVMRRTSVGSWVACEADLLDGIAWSVLDRGGQLR